MSTTGRSGDDGRAAGDGGDGGDGGDDAPGFAEAMEELNGIVTELESDALDVDHLAGRVARAAELVALCRDRIDGARFAVDEILDSMGQQLAAPTTVDED